MYCSACSRIPTSIAHESLTQRPCGWVSAVSAISRACSCGVCCLCLCLSSPRICLSPRHSRPPLLAPSSLLHLCNACPAARSDDLHPPAAERIDAACCACLQSCGQALTTGRGCAHYGRSSCPCPAEQRWGHQRQPDAAHTWRRVPVPRRTRGGARAAGTTECAGVACMCRRRVASAVRPGSGAGAASLQPNKDRRPCRHAGREARRPSAQAGSLPLPHSHPGAVPGLAALLRARRRSQSPGWTARRTAWPARPPCSSGAAPGPGPPRSG